MSIPGAPVPHVSFPHWIVNVEDDEVDEQEVFVRRISDLFVTTLETNRERARRWRAWRPLPPIYELSDLCWRAFVEMLNASLPWLDKIEWLIDNDLPLNVSFRIPNQVFTPLFWREGNHYTLKGRRITVPSNRVIDASTFEYRTAPRYIMDDTLMGMLGPQMRKLGLPPRATFSIPMLAAHGVSSMAQGWSCYLSEKWLVRHTETVDGRMYFVCDTRTEYL